MYHNKMAKRLPNNTMFQQIGPSHVQAPIPLLNRGRLVREVDPTLDKHRRPECLNGCAGPDDNHISYSEAQDLGSTLISEPKN